jgi:plastocyanin
MHNETLFYICGIVLAVSAVVVTFAGLKLKDFPGRAFPIIVLWFALFVGGATTFAVLHAQDEEAAKAVEHTEAGEGVSRTVKVEASPTELAFDTTELTAKGGTVTIDFKNPSAVPHDVLIEVSSTHRQRGGTSQITEGEESIGINLKPDTYTFFCSVPGHREAGMEGTLFVE